MENIKNLIAAVDAVALACREAHAVWSEVLGPKTTQALDENSIFANTVHTIVSQSEQARRQLAESCSITLSPLPDPSDVNLREYHIEEFINGYVVDGEGTVLDPNAFYCDQYKMNKLLVKALNEGGEKALASAQEAIAAYQSGTQVWPDTLSALALETVQPILNDVSSLSEILEELKKWHTLEADKNLDAFIAV